jgi:Tol biopolymer transport system component
MRATRIVMALLLIGGLVAAASPAGASYPGANGKIAFVRDGNIWTMAPDGTGQRQLTFFSGKAEAGSPRWSPDGTRIAYQAVRWYDGTLNADIWTMRANGTQKTRITTHRAPEDDPTWSPDGRWIAFTSHRPGDYSIYRVRSTSPYGAAIGVALLSEECLYEPCDTLYESGPDWSPAGGRILFDRVTNWAGSPAGWAYEIYSVPAFRVEPPTLLHPGFGAVDPSWAPGARRIALSRIEYDHYGPEPEGAHAANIVHVAPDGSDLRVVTHYRNDSERWARDPAWSPDGGRIIVYALHLTYSDTTRVFKVAANGLTAPVLLAWNASEPDWQPLP